jgi:acetolactate synthase-1/2/3 large subunit
MKIKVSDYIVNFFNRNGVDTLFTITGGFAMHLNDSFGKHGKYNIYYQHHEQACGYSAIGYCKTNSRPAIVCTTAGCAATNAITPCLIAHQDSLPVLFISGQVKSNESIRAINTDSMKLRHYAGADSDIISMVTPITKYAKEILSLDEVESVLAEAFTHLISGRPGPVWLSIPVDIQGFLIEVDDSYVNGNDFHIIDHINTTFSISNVSSNDQINSLHELLKEAKRPLIIAGNGIKLGNCIKQFNEFIEKYQIPVVVTILATDVMETDNPLYAGKIGLIGDRHGNFTMQNCDLLISFGCRMAQGIIGYRPDWFAREAKIVYFDNDPNELEKVNLNYHLKINMDLKTFFNSYNFSKNECDYSSWIQKCVHWKNKWIFETPNLSDENGINPYYALKEFYKAAPNNIITLCASGSIVTNVWHMVKVKNGDKFIHSSQGDMGFEIPAAIGAQIAEPEKMVIPILGEGSFQLNIQELQTIIQYKLPIKILLFNNGAYGAIQITQTNFFKNKFGVDYSSGLSFPDTGKVAGAYGLKYIAARKNEDFSSCLEEFMNCKEAVILEVFCCIQTRYPRLNAIKNDDGTFTNRPFEDMDPFLSRDEFASEMIVKIV